MRVILTEGRTDMYILRKLYQLRKKRDEILFIPCGGASEIMPVADEFKTKLPSWKIEAWVDNDTAGKDAMAELKTKFPSVKIVILGSGVKKGSIEDEVGFLAPTLYEEYTKLKLVDLVKNPSMKRKYKEVKHRLYEQILKVTAINESKKPMIDELFTKWGI